MSYDTSQICLNGHMITDSLYDSPDDKQEYCDKCGAKTIIACPNCGTHIKGVNRGGYMIIINAKVPAYCYKCGIPFPWTEARLQAARELINEVDELLPEEKTKFSDSLVDVIADTPRTPLAATRFGKALSKVGAPVAMALRDIFVDIASETAKKIIWPNG